MSSKTQRILEIKEIVGNQKISSQDELLSILKARGYDLTQATLSRDLKFLKVSRVMDEEKGYIYALPEKNIVAEETAPFSNGFVSIEFTKSLSVIKTKPGFASSIAYAIDNYDAYEFLGTIAGDDTILLIPRDNISPNDIKKVLVMIMPELDGKI